MFGGKYHQENAKNGFSERLDFDIFTLITLQSKLINFSRVSRLRNCSTRENCPPLKEGLCKSSVPSTTWTRLRVKVM